MAVETIKQRVIQLNFTDDDTDTLISVFNKLEGMSAKSGFRKEFSAEERELILQIITELKR